MPNFSQKAMDKVQPVVNLLHQMEGIFLGLHMVGNIVSSQRLFLHPHHTAYPHTAQIGHIHPLPYTHTYPYPQVPTHLPPPTETPAPTPTPFTYTVKKGDTMLAIAFNYGLSLEQLLAANPTAQPRMLSVGTVLVIPLEGVLATPEPTEAPLPLKADKPLCYPQADGGLWCLMLVLNDQVVAVENLTGRISLFSPSGESLSSQTAYAPLDILQPGEKAAIERLFPTASCR